MQEIDAAVKGRTEPILRYVENDCYMKTTPGFIPES